MLCRKCGNEIKENEKFCSNCGKSNKAINKKTNKRKSKLIIILISIIVLLSVAVGIDIIKTNNNKIENYVEGQSSTSIDNENLLDYIYKQYPEIKEEGIICTDEKDYWLLDSEGKKVYFTDINTFVKAMEQTNIGTENHTEELSIETYILAYSLLLSPTDTNWITNDMIGIVSSHPGGNIRSWFQLGLTDVNVLSEKVFSYNTENIKHIEVYPYFILNDYRNLYMKIRIYYNTGTENIKAINYYCKINVPNIYNIKAGMYTKDMEKIVSNNNVKVIEDNDDVNEIFNQSGITSASIAPYLERCKEQIKIFFPEFDIDNAYSIRDYGENEIRQYLNM